MSKRNRHKTPDSPNRPKSEPVGTVAQWWKQPWLPGLLLMGFVFVAYQSVWQAGFVWDDDAYITNNPLLTAPDGLWRIWFSHHQVSQYFPLVYTTFRIEHALWGLNPVGYHLVNLLFHGANAWLVWTLLRKLQVPGAWLAAAVFALHPVQVETAAWVTELKNTESTFFYLLTVLTWLRFLDGGTKRPWVWYVLALGLHLLALFAKTTACTLPAALVLVLWLRGDRLNGRRMWQVVPFVLSGLAMGLVSVWWEGHLGNYQAESGAEYGWLARVLIASRALWFYAGKVFWPVGMTFNYPKWQINPAEAVQYVWLLLSMVVGVVLWWKRKVMGRGVLAGVVFFVAALSPLIGFIWLYTFRYSFVADHHQYLACLGLIALAIALADRWTEKWGRVSRQASAALLLLGLGILTWRQGRTYQSLDTLWQATLARNPASWLAHDNLGTQLLSRGQTNEALAHFQQSLAAWPKDEAAWNNIGLVLFNQGRTAEAIAHYQKSIECLPIYALAHYNLAWALLQTGQLTEALAHYREAVKIEPGNPEFHNNYGNALRLAGDLDAAMAEFREALNLNPNDALAHNNLGDALCRIGQIRESLPHFFKALELDPNYASARNNLGNVFMQLGQVEAARTQYLKALESRPDYPDAHNNLGVCLFNLGQVDEAVTHWRRALQLNPRYVNACNNLAWVLATSPRDSLRNGPEALALAVQANQLSGGREPMIMRTLAAAYAENGRFAEAVNAARAAISSANPALATALQEQLQSYEAGRPYRDTVQPGLPDSSAPH